MRKVVLLMLSTLFVGQIYGQQVLTENHNVASDRLEEFTIDEQARTITAILKVKAKKGSIEYEKNVYSLDDLSLKENESFTLDVEKAKDRKFFSSRKKEPPMRLVKGENNAFGQFVLKRGYYYLSVSSGTVGNWTTTRVTEKFEVEVKEKPKGIDGDKMSMVIYASDAPKYSEYRADFLKVNNINKATGDISAFLYEKEKPFYTKYAVCRWGANDLELKTKKEFEFDTPYFPISAKVMKNGDMALIFSDPACNPDIPLLYLRVDGDGNEVDRVEFKLDISGMHNFWIDDDGEGNTFITGLTTQGAPLVIVGVGEITTNISGYYKFDGNRMNFTKPDYMTFIQLRDGAVVYTDQSPVEDHLNTAVVQEGDKIKLPKAAKAMDEFKWNKMGYGTFITKTIGDKTFVLGHDYNKELHYVAQYDRSNGLERTYFKSRELPSGPNQFFHSSNDKLYWFLGEVNFEEQTTRTELNMINPASGQIQTMYQSPKGFSPSATNFLNFINEENGVILVEFSDKGKEIMLTKVDF
ncbi:MAG: hypothetical protein AAGC47_12715 [Bacteroidota bacterium]